MKSFRSWLLLAILVGLVAKSVFSFPANRAVDISNDLLTEDTDSDDGDNDDSSDDSKKAEIAGSGDASKKTAVEESKSESSPEEASGSDESGEKQKKENTEQSEEGDEEDSYDNDDNKRTDLPKPKPKAKTSLKKRDGGCCWECPEEKEEECCHHQHENEKCCHNGCCCGHHNDHMHDHFEDEDCCHHHGHHHGFCHEWGHDCCGDHHGHECCGHHEHENEHKDDHEHCHDHCHHCCEKHEEEEPECCCCCDHKRRSKVHRRSDILVGYHCHDMVSKYGSEKTRRFCVPVYGETRSSRSDIPSVVKKQTVHVGYGYASGDNYRLGYQEGGMGGLASSFTGQIGPDHGGNFDLADHFNKKSLHNVHGYRQKRLFDTGHGFGAFNSGMMHGSATPYGHPGHALALQDVRNMIPHP